MIAKKYGAEIHYIQGKNNIFADALSRLGIEPSTKLEPNPEANETPETRKLTEAFIMDKLLTRLNITSVNADFYYKQTF